MTFGQILAHCVEPIAPILPKVDDRMILDQLT